MNELERIAYEKCKKLLERGADVILKAKAKLDAGEIDTDVFLEFVEKGNKLQNEAVRQFKEETGKI